MTSTRVPPAVSACAALLGDPQWRWEGVVARRHNSRVHRLAVGERTVAVKECFHARTERPDRDAAAQEFEALQTLFQHFTNAVALAPAPLAWSADHAAFAMSWVPGRNATALVLAITSTTRTGATAGAAAGEWLRRFHSAGPPAHQPPDFSLQIELLQQRADPRLRDDALFRRATRALSRAADAARGTAAPIAWTHGDMKSDNVIIDGHSAIGIDIQLVHCNQVTHDLAQFVNHARLLRWSLRGAVKGASLKAMEQAFLEAYGPDTVAWQLAIDWFRAYLLVHRIGPSSWLGLDMLRGRRAVLEGALRGLESA